MMPHFPELLKPGEIFVAFVNWFSKGSELNTTWIALYWACYCKEGYGWQYFGHCIHLHSPVMTTSVIRPDFWSKKTRSHSAILCFIQSDLPYIRLLPNTRWCFLSFQLITNPSMMALDTHPPAPRNAILSGRSIPLCTLSFLHQELIQFAVRK